MLEIIGNAKNVKGVQRHFSKMFQGINQVELDQKQVITAMMSKEKETIPFINKISY